MTLEENVKIIRVEKKGQQPFRTRGIWQYDRGHVLVFEDFGLPETFQVHFAQSADGEAKPQVGQNDTCALPDEYTQSSGTVYAWVYVADLETGLTKCQIEIPVESRGENTDEEPTPVQQSALDQAIAALNDGVTRAETARQEAVEAKTAAAESERKAKASEEAAAESERKSKASEEAAAESERKSKASEGAAAVSERKSKSKASEEAAAESERKSKASEEAAAESERKSKASEEAAAESERKAKASEEAAGTSEGNAEGWAVGKRGGTDVPATDPTWHNNAKYYAGRAEETLTQATETIRTEKNAAVEAVQQKGQEVLDSIPADYSEMSEALDAAPTEETAAQLLAAEITETELLGAILKSFSELPTDEALQEIRAELQEENGWLEVIQSEVKARMEAV